MSGRPRVVTGAGKARRRRGKHGQMSGRGSSQEWARRGEARRGEARRGESRSRMVHLLQLLITTSFRRQLLLVRSLGDHRLLARRLGNPQRVLVSSLRRPQLLLLSAQLLLKRLELLVEGLQIHTYSQSV